MKMHHYNFKSHWHITGDQLVSRHALLDVQSWPMWWPGLVTVKLLNWQPQLVGSRADMVWQAPFGYHLQVTITITDYNPSTGITFESVGDLQGKGRWQFDALDDGLKMTIHWQVQTTKRWMNLMAFALRPLFIAAHHTVMKEGQRGLQRYLATNNFAIQSGAR